MNTSRDLAIVVLNENEPITQTEIKAISDAGFKNVFIQWYNENWNYSQEEQLKYIKELGLNVIFAHLGYQNINDIWQEGNVGDLVVARYINDIEAIKRNNIPMVVMHLTSKTIAPPFGEIGLARLKKIIDISNKNNIKVAFENTKIKGYLDYVLSNIKDDNVGVCFDSGHYHCHFNDDLDFKLFKDRIFAVHLHDNDKKGDWHVMPFEGTIDWPSVIKNLKSSGYNGPISLELERINNYPDMSYSEFYKKAYAIGKKLDDMFKD